MKVSRLNLINFNVFCDILCSDYVKIWPRTFWEIGWEGRAYQDFGMGTREARARTEFA